ncbi:putative cation-transporting ATPase 13A4 [Lissotriton helveticus]
MSRNGGTTIINPGAEDEEKLTLNPTPARQRGEGSGTPGMERDPEKHRHALLNQGEENEMEMFGYKTHPSRRVLCIIGHILSLGLLLFLFYWKPEWEVWANCTPSTLKDADVLLLRTTDDFKTYSRKKVRWIYLSALLSLPSKKGDFVFAADENAIINRAIMKPEHKVRFIQVQKIRYVWDSSENQFTKIGALEDKYSCTDIHTKFGSGYTSEEQEIRKLICGPNVIEVEVVPVWKLLFKEVLNPFYLFQAFAMALWLYLENYEIPAVIIFMTVVSVIVTTYDLRKQSVNLHKLVAANNNVMVTVGLKTGEYKEVESHNLIPGDVVILTGNKLYLPCDAVLINGSCIVDEGMLTGESVPVTKMPLPDADSSMPWKEYSGEDYKRHILFCGTNLLQCKTSGSGPARAVVLQTGFNTAKGDLVRSILYSRPVDFKLHRDAVRFIMCLAVFGLIAVIYTIVVYSRAGKPTWETILMGISVMTIAVPPALLAALAVGVMYAQKRLKNKRIFCFCPQRINLWGQANIVCFDKTGTLTEDGLDLWGLVPSGGNSFQTVHKFSSGAALPWGPLLGALASCHSLMVIDGKLQGDPLDLKMFEGTYWEIEDQSISEDGKGNRTSSMILKPGPKASKVPVEGLAIVHQFPFSSGLQRMSVVTQVVGGDQCLAFMKGAPEKVISFCRPETVPSNFSSKLQIYTKQGFRVIGLAYKPLPSKTPSELRSLARDDVESNLEFLGLLVMENQLKPETKPVLEELLEAKFRAIMVTGDNLQTALTVGKRSGMIPESTTGVLVMACGPNGFKPASITLSVVEDRKSKMDGVDETFISIEEKFSYAMQLENYYFAMDGKTFQVILQHFYSLLPKFLLNGVIFARMSPRLKASLVEELIKLDYVVGMCGDGANDCGALRTAHVGISLSEQEASMASPFTSQTPNIECVSEVIKEGRCALVTSFAVFKFMTMYAATTLINQVLLNWHCGLFGRFQYLIIDVAITTGVCLTISLNGAYPKLSTYRPTNHLMSPPFVLSICLQALFAFIIQVAGYASTVEQPWYNATNIHSACLTGNLDVTMSAFRTFEGTTLFPLYEGNLIIAAFVFAKGKPFRKPVYTNYLFSLLLFALTALGIFLIFGDFEGLYIVSQLACVPTPWRFYLFIAVIILFIVCYGVEEAIIDNRALWVWIKKTVNYKSKSQYQKLHRLLERTPQWPPINQTIYPDSVGTVMETDRDIYYNPAFNKNDHVTTKI